jgi:hypothetical protein
MCLNSDTLVAPIACPDNAIPNVRESVTVSTLEATITKGIKIVSPCGQTTWNYQLTYDNNLLVDPTYSLLTTDINSVFCKGCLTTWVEELKGQDVKVIYNDDGDRILVNEHGCEFDISTTGFTVDDTATLTLLLSGGILVGNVRLSTKANNGMSIETNGLYYPNPLLAISTATQSSGGGGIETDLMSYVVQGNIVDQDYQRIELYSAGTFSSNTDTKTVRAYWGATELIKGTITGDATPSNWEIFATIIRTSVTAIKWSATFRRSGSNGASVVNMTGSQYVSTAVTNFAANQTTKITGQSTSAAEVTAEMFLVKKYLEPTP